MLFGIQDFPDKGMKGITGNQIFWFLSEDSKITQFFWGSPGGAVAKNPPANAGDTGSSPGPGRSHMPQSN